MEHLSINHAIVHVAVLAIMLLIYQWLYRFRNGFVFNRVYLILSLLLSLIVPFISYDVFPQYINWVAPDIEISSSIATEVDYDNTTPIWLKVYLGIVVFCMLVFTYRVIGIYRQMRQNHKLSLAGNYTGSPMSFFNWIAVPDSCDDIILSHEQYHVNALHSIDRIVLGYIHCLLWWNPLIIYLHKLIIENHEMAADKASILRTGLSPVQYLEHLQSYLQRTHSNQKLSLANTYYSLIENRAIMIQKNKKLTHRLALAVLPILAIVFCAFTFKTYPVIQSNGLMTSDTIPDNLIIIDTVTVFDMETKKENTTIVTNSTVLKDYLSHMKFSGKTIERKDTLTVFDYDTYEETVTVYDRKYPVEIEELLMQMDWDMYDLIIDLSMKEMKRQLGK